MYSRTNGGNQMNESRVFMLNGTDMQKIVTRLEGFFRTEKGMEVQRSETPEGYVIQARRTDGKLLRECGLPLPCR